jgi:hypothetical protein
MKAGGGRGSGPGQPHSERAGEALLDAGERAELYRALRDLSCSRCGGLIRAGDLFTREAEPATGLPLVRRCRACVPFKPSGGLLDVLFDDRGGSGAATTDAAERAREKILARLGPALAARDKRKGGG